jgi:hypothetical protein
MTDLSGGFTAPVRRRTAQWCAGAKRDGVVVEVVVGRRHLWRFRHFRVIYPLVLTG